jgi:hypothetical protein
MQQKRNACRAVVRKPAERRPPGRPEDGNILKWILKQKGLKAWTVLMWLRTKKAEDSCEHGDELPISQDARKK